MGVMAMKKDTRVSAIAFALLAAVLYALNTPLSKVIMKYVPPTFMAAFLYLGAGVGVGILYLFRWREENPSERLTKPDLPYAAGMILLDIAAPVFLMIGINLGTASNASLLGNFEIVTTTLIALLLFKEKVSGRLWLAIGLITLSSLILSFEGEGSFRFSLGSLFVLLATCCWGFENNCTRKISHKSTYQIVVLKGLFSGGGSFLIALALGEPLPAGAYAAGAMVLGFVAYGLSIFFYVRSQRTLGAAKTSAYYAAAPFIGVLLAFTINGERPAAAYFLALALMLGGTVFVVYDTLAKHHAHGHTHVIVHTHNGTTHTHVLTHAHGHDHFVSEEKHGHHHQVYLNSPEHWAAHANQGQSNP